MIFSLWNLHHRFYHFLLIYHLSFKQYNRTIRRKKFISKVTWTHRISQTKLIFLRLSLINPKGTLVIIIIVMNVFTWQFEDDFYHHWILSNKKRGVIYCHSDIVWLLLAVPWIVLVMARLIFCKFPFSTTYKVNID